MLKAHAAAGGPIVKPLIPSDTTPGTADASLPAGPHSGDAERANVRESEGGA